MLKKFSKDRPQLSSALKFALKIGLSALAIYLVFTQIDLEEVWALLRSASVPLLIIASVFFNFSKLVAAHRQLLLFREMSLKINARYNLRLYYIGMFYNLFLPGGVGGDGYKVIHLRARSESKSKLLVAAVLLDRLSGAAALSFLGLAIAGFYPSLLSKSASWVYPLVVVGALAALPAFAVLLEYVFPTFRKLRWPLITGSIGVQGAQLICAACILWSLGVEDHLFLYLALFLASSLAAMLPISFGGIGLRELVFLYAAQYLPIDQTAAVSLGLIFFLITAISSLAGAFIKLPPKLS